MRTKDVDNVDLNIWGILLEPLPRHNHECLREDLFVFRVVLGRHEYTVLHVFAMSWAVLTQLSKTILKPHGERKVPFGLCACAAPLLLPSSERSSPTMSSSCLLKFACRAMIE